MYLDLHPNLPSFLYKICRFFDRWKVRLLDIKSGMHGCNSGSALLVNAEVDSMGGVVDGGVGIGLKTSPRRAAIEKAQAVLR